MSRECEYVNWYDCGMCCVAIEFKCVITSSILPLPYYWMCLFLFSYSLRHCFSLDRVQRVITLDDYIRFVWSFVGAIATANCEFKCYFFLQFETLLCIHFVVKLNMRFTFIFSLTWHHVVIDICFRLHLTLFEFERNCWFYRSYFVSHRCYY